MACTALAELLWRIELLGGLRAVRGERVIDRFRSRKSAELLAYLAYHPRRPHPREVLIELLWPECDPDAGRNRLSTILSALRHELEPPGVPDGAVLESDRHSAGLNAAAVTTDVAELERALKDASRTDDDEERLRLLSSAVELYGGELLQGCYEDWILPEQQRLDELYFQALRQLIAQLERAGDLSSAIRYALRAAAANRFREEAHREVIRLYAADNQPDVALRRYRELERLLRQELDAAPSAATRSLVEQIRSGRPDEGTTGREDGTRQLIVHPAIPALVRSSTPHAEALPRSQQLEPVGGAVPLGSPLYVVRSTDGELHAAIGRGDSVVVLKGPRQVGKTSLLARGLQHARDAQSMAASVALSHLQVLCAADLESSGALLRALAEMLADQLDVETRPADCWTAEVSPNLNFRRYLRRCVLAELSTHLVWGMDELDRLFAYDFAGEVFALFRSWHDERALDPAGPWSRLTLAMACSTEAHLFITDLNQSPFNVGTRLTLADFSLDEVADLNRRYGSPIADDAGVARYHRLAGGHPYLTRCGLHEMVAHGTSLAALEARATADDWIFGEHLRRMLGLLARDQELIEAVRGVLAERALCSAPLADASFYRLRSAGVLTGTAPEEARPRCGIYASYLRRHLT